MNTQHHFSAEEDDLRRNPLVADSLDRDGQSVVVLRDSHGAIAYPSAVPPTVVSPPPTSNPAASTPLAPPPCSPSAGQRPQSTATPGSKSARAASAEVPVSSAGHVHSHAPEPQARRPMHLARKSTFRPVVMKRRRGGTQLSRALSSYPTGDVSSDTSTSDDDEERVPRHKETTQGADSHAEAGAQPRHRYDRFHVGNDQYQTHGKIKRDGRLRITVKDTSNMGYLAKALGSAVNMIVPQASDADPYHGRQSPRGSDVTRSSLGKHTRPRLNIVIMVIGSRGDVQPFLKIGKVLQDEYGHRVRLATHPAFREFVEKDSGLEFFSVGGDPSELMAFMVKNPGMIPSIESVKAGDIGKRRDAMAEMFQGFWRACINATDDEKDVKNLKMMGEKSPFVADAIIANPPSFAHIHCAEALGIPLHLMFTFPYTPTQAFPHPLAIIKKSNVDPGYTNFMSYPLVEMMVWQGLGDLVNDFRTKTLGLDPVSTLWAPGATYRLHVPFSYLWSPGLVPKPEDWGPEIDVSGFVFLDLASSFKPPEDLAKFLSESEEPPIYIGFGSIVVDDPDKFTQMIFDAVKEVGCRALVSKGWGGLGGKAAQPPENVFMLENTPHDWLFPRVKACVIHGGAGTTAISLKCGRPTMVVPFFGDQNFWGKMLAAAGVGPEPVPYKRLNVQRLVEGIKYLITDEAAAAAAEMARDIEEEGDGAENAVNSFHRHLGFNKMRCSILEDRVAVWKVKGSNVKLSALAAEIAVDQGLLHWKSMRLLRHCEWNDFDGPGEPVTGLAGSIAGTVGDVLGGVGGVPYRLAKISRKRKAKSEAKKKKREEAKEERKKEKQGSGNAKDKKSKEKSESGAEAEEANGVESSGKRATPRRADTIMTEPPTPGEVPLSKDIRLAEEVIGEGVTDSAAALARAPVALSMAVAQGFHNAPRLYGDDTVRRPPRVTGIRSGLKAAGAEFVYGIYDGVTGVVRLPYRGAKQKGVRGAAKGVAMGLTGFVLKDISAIIGPVGYTLKGIAKQIERGRGPVKLVRLARMAQGHREANNKVMLLEALQETGGATRDNQIETIKAEGGDPSDMKRVAEQPNGQQGEDGDKKQDNKNDKDQLSPPNSTVSNQHQDTRDRNAVVKSQEEQRSTAKLRQEVDTKVVKGWLTLRKLEHKVDAIEKEVAKNGGLIAKLRHRRVPHKYIDVGVDAADKALVRLDHGETVEQVFGEESGVKRGLLGERISIDASARRSMQEESARAEGLLLPPRNSLSKSSMDRMRTSNEYSRRSSSGSTLHHNSTPNLRCSCKRPHGDGIPMCEAISEDGEVPQGQTAITNKTSAMPARS